MNEFDAGMAGGTVFIGSEVPVWTDQKVVTGKDATFLMHVAKNCREKLESCSQSDSDITVCGKFVFEFQNFQQKY